MKLEALRCDSCGGLIDRATLTCRSCGMMFRQIDNEHVVRLEVQEMRTEVLHSRITVSKELLKYCEPQDVLEHSIKELAHKFAEQLIPYMEYELSEDPATLEESIYSRIRILRPVK